MNTKFKAVMLVFVIVIGVFTLSKSVDAQTSVQEIIPSMNIPLPGTCGDSFSPDPSIQKCCKTPVYTPELYEAELIKNLPFFGSALSDFVSRNFKDKMSAVMFTQRQVSIQACLNGVPSTPGDPNNAKCICIQSPTPPVITAFEETCGKMDPRTNEKDRCLNCTGAGGVWTSLGCFNGRINEFIQEKILGTGVGIAGGITLLCIMLAAFQMQASRGNAEKVKKAQELLTNCITGLMVIIFSVLILKIIGIDILRLPGFTL